MSGESVGPPDAARDEEILHAQARAELSYATCPRCGARNPEGVADEARANRVTRVLGVLVFAAVGVGVLFHPWFAIAVAVLSLGNLVVTLRARQWKAVAFNVAAVTVGALAAFRLPYAELGVAALSFAAALRFALHRFADDRFARAAGRIRFANVYR